MVTCAVGMKTIFDVNFFFFHYFYLSLLLYKGSYKWFYKRFNKFKIKNSDDKCMFMWNMSSVAICFTFSCHSN